RGPHRRGQPCIRQSDRGRRAGPGRRRRPRRNAVPLFGGCSARRGGLADLLPAPTLARVRRTAFALAGSAALIAIGLLGATAFNPDDGVVVHSEPLWRVFGIGAYVGALTFWLSV